MELGELNQIVSEILGSRKRSVLSASYKELESYYRLADRDSMIATKSVDQLELALAYMAVRMPSIYQILDQLLDELARTMGRFQPTNMLDFGSGPGTAIWAANKVWPSISDITAIERQHVFSLLAKEINHSSHKPLAITWSDRQILEKEELKFDLVVASYVLVELGSLDRIALVKSLWNVTEGFLLIVNPGTQEGFESLLEARSSLISLGAYILGPCAGNFNCPNNWCHFSRRVARTKDQRILKGASLGYEDEHYSYLLISRIAPKSSANRVIGTVRKDRLGYTFNICSDVGELREVRIGKKDVNSDMYQKIKRLKWGDLIDSDLVSFSKLIKSKKC